MKISTPKTSRRQVLKILGLGLLASGSSYLFFRIREASSRLKLYVPAPKIYLNFDQDFSQVKFKKEFLIEGIKRHDKELSNLTVVGLRGENPHNFLFSGLIHTVLVDAGKIYLIPTDQQRWLYKLDQDSMELEKVFFDKKQNFGFAGHAVSIPNSDFFAVTMNSGRVGEFDRVSIRRKSDLKEVEAYSTHGFEAHDIKLSRNGKHLLIGHYGSLLGSGPYTGMATKEFKDQGSKMQNKQNAYYITKYTNVYPGLVSVIELQTGRLINKLSSINSGAHCHLVERNENELYMPFIPSKLYPRGDEYKHPWFNEGVHGPNKKDLESFAPKMARGFGTSILYDEIFDEVIIPSRWSEEINVLPQGDDKKWIVKDILKDVPNMKLTHGLVFHPDMKKYFLTGNNWVASYERGTHNFIEKYSFPMNLFVHAHSVIG